MKLWNTLYYISCEKHIFISTPEEKESQSQGDNKDDCIEDDDVGEIRSSGRDPTILAGSDDHVLEVWLATKKWENKLGNCKYYSFSFQISYREQRDFISLFDLFVSEKY